MLYAQLIFWSDQVISDTGIGGINDYSVDIENAKTSSAYKDR